MFTPPVSNVTPFPIITNGLSFFESFRFVISITFGFEEEDLQMTRDWLRSRGNTIEGGTSEVQLNIVAKRVLGLP